MEMNYCRRCGSVFIKKDNHVFTCKNSHIIYANASPAVAVIIINQQGDILITKRARDPKKGQLDLPGGYCDGPENLENALYRELEEELGLLSHQYTAPKYVYSGIDYYDYSQESLPFLSCTFVVYLKEMVTIEPKDDVAEAYFVPVDSVKPKDFCYSNIQNAFTTYVKSLDI